MIEFTPTKVEQALALLIDHLAKNGIVAPRKVNSDLKNPDNSYFENVILTPLSNVHDYESWISDMCNNTGPEYVLHISTQETLMHYRLIIADGVGLVRLEVMGDNGVPQLLHTFRADKDMLVNNQIGTLLLRSHNSIKERISFFNAKRVQRYLN